jgi:hypothetical protein
VNVFGPLARGADDLALLLDVLAGPDRPVPRPPSVESPAGLRVAAWFDDPTMTIDDESRGVLEAAAEALEALGATVDRAARPAFDAEDAWRTGLFLIGAGVSVSDDVDRGLTHRDWLFLDRRRARHRAAWAEFFTAFDVLSWSPRTRVRAPAGRWADAITISGRPRPRPKGSCDRAPRPPVGSTPGTARPALHERQIVAHASHHTAIVMAG